MDFWVTNDNQEKCYQSMAKVLQKHVKKEQKVSFKKWTEKDIMKLPQTKMLLKDIAAKERIKIIVKPKLKTID